ncbi:hypothetical protein EVA_13449, partial [gut metagenome]
YGYGYGYGQHQEEGQKATSQNGQIMQRLNQLLSKIGIKLK